MDTFCYKFTIRTGCLIIGYFHAITSGGAFPFCLWLHFLGVQGRDVYGPVGFLVLKFFAVNILYLIGVYKDKAEYILPWLAWISIYVMIQSVMTVRFLIHLYDVAVGIWLVVIIAVLSYFAMQIYFIIVVSTHYHKMQKKSSATEEVRVPL